jgi:hypothetical protein
MKKTLLIAAALLVSASAFAQQTYSVNVVGYNKVTLIEDKYNMFSTAWLHGTDNTIEDLLGDLPSGTTVLIWDSGSQSYLPSIGKTRGGWDAGATNVIERGSAVFVLPPAGQGNQEVIVAGEVPNDSVFTNFSVGGYAIISYPYTADTVFSNTAFYANSESGDAVSFWDPVTGYQNFSKTRGGWDTGVETQAVTMGTAFFYNAPSGGTEVETQPYTLSN